MPLTARPLDAGLVGAAQRLDERDAVGVGPRVEPADRACRRRRAWAR